MNKILAADFNQNESLDKQFVNAWKNIESVFKSVTLSRLEY